MTDIVGVFGLLGKGTASPLTKSCIHWLSSAPNPLGFLVTIHTDR